MFRPFSGPAPSLHSPGGSLYLRFCSALRPRRWQPERRRRCLPGPASAPAANRLANPGRPFLAAESAGFPPLLLIVLPGPCSPGAGPGRPCHESLAGRGSTGRASAPPCTIEKVGGPSIVLSTSCHFDVQIPQLGGRRPRTRQRRCANHAFSALSAAPWPFRCTSDGSKIALHRATFSPHLLQAPVSAFPSSIPFPVALPFFDL